MKRNDRRNGKCEKMRVGRMDKGIKKGYKEGVNERENKQKKKKNCNKNEVWKQGIT